MNRDAHDIEEYKREIAEQSGTNIQPNTLVKLMAASEPCMFNNKNLVELVPTQLDVVALFHLGLMCKTARQHGQEQIEYWKELAKYRGYWETEPSVSGLTE